jgi:hypothetical protein
MERFVKTLQDVKKLEETMTAQREAFSKEILESVHEELGYLAQLGCHYELVEKDSKPKIGRPRKEAKNGAA